MTSGRHKKKHRLHEWGGRIGFASVNMSSAVKIPSSFEIWSHALQKKKVGGSSDKNAPPAAVPASKPTPESAKAMVDVRTDATASASNSAALGSSKPPIRTTFTRCNHRD